MSDPPLPRVVIALCYEDDGGFLVIPDCPYCFIEHKHRVPHLKPLKSNYLNGMLAQYEKGMAIKISDCLTAGRSYALALCPRSCFLVAERPKLLCHGITQKGTACKRAARPSVCVCTLHYRQLEDIVTARLAELYGT